MLDALEEPGALTIAELTGVTGLTTRRAHAVANSLAERGLVFISREGIGWKGVGGYGPLVKRATIEAGQQRYHYGWINLESVPVVVVKKGEAAPDTVDDATDRTIQKLKADVTRQRADEMRRVTAGMPADEAAEYKRAQNRRWAAIDREQRKRRPRTLGKDTEYIHTGVPVYGLVVTEIEFYRRRRAEQLLAAAGARAENGVPPMTEEHIIEKYGPAV
jgi:hypothetical protein